MLYISNMAIRHKTWVAWQVVKHHKQIYKVLGPLLFHESLIINKKERWDSGNPARQQITLDGIQLNLISRTIGMVNIFITYRYAPKI